MKLFTIIGSLSLMFSSPVALLNSYKDDNIQISNEIDQNNLVSPDQINSYHLDIEPIMQETNYYCVPAAFQMVLRYFGANINRPELSQQQIYNDLNGIGQNGVIITQATTDHLNNLIQLFGTESPATYELTSLNWGFGATLTDQTMFELYVTYSLYRNVPLLLTRSGITSFDPSHELVIAGIDINLQSPADTVYTLADPINGSFFSIPGWYLPVLFIRGGYIMGLQSSFNFSQQIITAVNENPQDIQFNSLGAHQVNVRNNLTYSVGITNIRQLNFFRNIDWGFFNNSYHFNNQAVMLHNNPIDGLTIEDNNTTPFYTSDFEFFTDYSNPNRTFFSTLNLSTSNSTTRDGFMFDFNYQLINTVIGDTNNVNSFVHLDIGNDIVFSMGS